MGGAVGLLSGAIDALTAVDPDTLTDPELHAMVVSLHRLGDRLTKSARARLARETASSETSTGRALRRAAEAGHDASDVRGRHCG